MASYIKLSNEKFICCLKYAKKLKLINYLPTDIEKVSQESKKVMVWADNQLKFFLRQIKDTNLYLPALIISLAGLRIGEMCGLRHTHATILLLKGENIKVISERLGHKSTKITWDTYSHVLPSMKKQTADLLDDVFNDL
ncbi:MAG: tyrosine-type recombinase/integrase [Clostridium sp.]|uniref:tyrosine-type recombinase/integrase n=2 Tax=Clostridium neonatale TaxID=137838 RepID=UPI001DA9F58D|nr:tyrosine-type recombinase/integrase [Clostridium neonatale]MBS5950603.1 tyrosine-type recombinase/integrase [Clostridium sp.]CAI3237715.1 hypothetical protein CNEO2_250046 [Clostridium neonatale]CAI3597942.1 hypothetical protein CNEO3_40069 [Clostridium neonatale]CAI3710607.1 hypothetical protein CNEO4_870020 [Clostridium neonatale]